MFLDQKRKRRRIHVYIIAQSCKGLMIESMMCTNMMRDPSENHAMRKKKLFKQIISNNNNAVRERQRERETAMKKHVI